jgi:hypothetical protein
MAIVKATYTKHGNCAKASIRYIEHRPGKEGGKITRTLFGRDGAMERSEAYRMIDRAEKGSAFFRFVLSPDPQREDTERDLHLRAVTELTMQHLEDRLHQSVSWVAVEHADHAPHRHVHIVAVVAGRLNVQDFASLRKSATEACIEQRYELDVAREHRQQERTRKEAQWELGY